VAKKSSKKKSSKKSLPVKNTNDKKLFHSLEWMKLNYFNVFILVGYFINFIFVLIHNTLLASIYFALLLIKLITITTIKKNKLNIKKLSDSFELSNYEDIILIFYPLIPALFYTDIGAVVILIGYWLTVIVIKEYQVVVKLFRKLIKKS